VDLPQQEQTHRLSITFPYPSYSLGVAAFPQLLATPFIMKEQDRGNGHHSKNRAPGIYQTGNQRRNPAVAAMVAVNSVLNPIYLTFLNIPVEVQFGALEIAKPLSLWINDGLMAPLALGIAAGLMIGKQLGVLGFMFAATKPGLVQRPEGVRWMQLYGLACLTGIGFTMSLFIGNLAFADPEQIETVKLGVISGSLVSGVLESNLLRFAPKQTYAASDATEPKLA